MTTGLVTAWLHPSFIQKSTLLPPTGHVVLMDMGWDPGGVEEALATQGNTEAGNPPRALAFLPFTSMLTTVPPHPPPPCCTVPMPRTLTCRTLGRPGKVAGAGVVVGGGGAHVTPSLDTPSLA